jgi:hypothetical protein
MSAVWQSFQEKEKNFVILTWANDSGAGRSSAR